MSLKAKVDSPAYVLAFAATVSLAFTAAIMALHAVTAETARRNARLHEQKALVELFGLQAEARRAGIDALIRARVAGYGDPHADPGDLRRRPIRLRDPQTGRDIPLLVAYRRDLPPGRRPDVRDKANVLAYAFGVSGVGFWARIDGYLAVAPGLDRIVGIVFLEHSETPGLGGRLTEEAWRAKFRNLDVTPPARGGEYIYVGGERPSGPDSPRRDRHVDAITGATGTSAAVGAFLNRRLAEFRRAAEAAGLTGSAAPAQGAPTHPGKHG
jgi:hypothetical protein